MSAWDRKLWGVYHVDKGKVKFLVGSRWAKERNAFPSHPLEPTRALLFMTCRQAQAWCKEQNIYYRTQMGGVCDRWRMRAVRVRERLTVIKRQGG